MPISAKPITVRGVEYPTIVDAAKAFGIDPEKFRDRLRYNWTPEEALELVPRKAFVRREYDLTLNGKKYNDFKELGDAFGIEGSKIRQRFVKYAWTLRQAVGLDPAPERPPKKNLIEFEGIEYPNRSELARAYGIRPGLVQTRLNSGWSLRQALEVDPAPKKGSWRRDADIIDGRAYPNANEGKYLLYLITCITNSKEYVGVTTGSLEKRWGEHVSNAINSEAGGFNKLYRAIRKYGPDLFKIELIRDDARNYKELLEQEQLEVAKRDSFKRGYNATAGGETTHSPRELKVGDLVFPTLRAAETHFGVDESVIRSRIDSLGWTVEQAVSIAPRPTDWGAKETTVEGKTFPSLKAAAEAYGVDYRKVFLRLDRYGWTLEEALNLKKRFGVPPGAPKEIEFHGVRYSSIAKLAEAYGVNKGSFYSRIKSGWTLEEAVGLKDKVQNYGHNKIPISVNDKTYDSLKDCAKTHGVDYNLVHGRLKRGWSIEEALELKEHPNAPKGIVFNGLKYKSRSSLARAYNIKPSKFFERVQSGWSIEEALELEERANLPTCSPQEIEFDGLKYKSNSALARAFGIKPSKFGERRRAGWTVEEALGLTERVKPS